MKRWIAVFVTLYAAGCQQPNGELEATRQPVVCGAPMTAILQRLPKGDRELPTTPADQFLAGLNGQVSAAEQMVLNDPTSATKQIALASLLGARGKLFGNLDEVQRAIDTATRAIAIAPDEPAAYLERASLQQSLHRFPASRADLAVAKRLSGDARAIAGIEQELDWNEGRYELAIAAIRSARVASPNVFTVSREARLMHDLGDIAAADRLYAEAEDLIDDTSPVVAAFLNFQRGYHAFELGRIDEAIVFYREAVRRVPTWITAQEHLAEVLVLTGKTTEALALYEDVVARSTDPELAGALGDLYAALGRADDAARMHERASIGFEAYAAKFPEAAWGHASEFYLGTGNDPARALAMREANVRLRPNGASLASLADARLALGDVAGAREAIERALKTPLRSGYISWTAARVSAASNDPARARAFAADACAQNPRVALDEAPLAL